MYMYFYTADENKQKQTKTLGKYPATFLVAFE